MSAGGGPNAGSRSCLSSEYQMHWCMDIMLQHRLFSFCSVLQCSQESTAIHFTLPLPLRHPPH
jgi:hypothetical protein